MQPYTVGKMSSLMIGTARALSGEDGVGTRYLRPAQHLNSARPTATSAPTAASSNTSLLQP